MIRVVTLCSGYDSQCLALDRLKKTHGVDYELVAWSEIDKFYLIAMENEEKKKHRKKCREYYCEYCIRHSDYFGAGRELVKCDETVKCDRMKRYEQKHG